MYLVGHFLVVFFVSVLNTLLQCFYGKTVQAKVLLSNSILFRGIYTTDFRLSFLSSTFIYHLTIFINYSLEQL